ncbi:MULTISPECIES: EthD family reductase [Roseobacteraceae]|uniref:EthD family reductase n=1 Tax=Celeribacter baekdonensis TaxID=875171 RepID=A0A2R4M9D5_9RHOB|nr:EthD family reductase [Celeribacter baekdonensis]AVW93630.1 EthD family reductase [Celeribacter baekdonensis]AVW93707.1 EthD family reductase [Celeribacter baekdonensis]KAB6714615.1 EthD family reductase [Roseobacter sp. TSBP12]
MYCLCVEYPTPVDPDYFRNYYDTRHLPLAQRLPGLISYEVAYPSPLREGAHSPFCVFRAYFASPDDMQKALFSEEGSEVASDVPNYSPNGCHMFHHPVNLTKQAAA